MSPAPDHFQRLPLPWRLLLRFRVTRSARLLDSLHFEVIPSWPKFFLIAVPLGYFWYDWINRSYSFADTIHDNVVLDAEGHPELTDPHTRRLIEEVVGDMRVDRAHEAKLVFYADGRMHPWRFGSVTDGLGVIGLPQRFALHKQSAFLKTVLKPANKETKVSEGQPKTEKTSVVKKSSERTESAETAPKTVAQSHQSPEKVEEPNDFSTQKVLNDLAARGVSLELRDQLARVMAAMPEEARRFAIAREVIYVTETLVGVGGMFAISVVNTVLPTLLTLSAYNLPRVLGDLVKTRTARLCPTPVWLGIWSFAVFAAALPGLLARHWFHWFLDRRADAVTASLGPAYAKGGAMYYEHALEMNKILSRMRCGASVLGRYSVRGFDEETHAERHYLEHWTNMSSLDRRERFLDYAARWDEGTWVLPEGGGRAVELSSLVTKGGEVPGFGQEEKPTDSQQLKATPAPSSAAPEAKMGGPDSKPLPTAKTTQ